MEIRYLRRNEIDTEAWDRCIAASPDSRIYACSWHLDIMADHWDALVGDDYQAVFPLPWNKKLAGLRQAYQPAFSQQLGLFARESPGPDLLKTFLQSIPSSYRYISLALHEGTSFSAFGKWQTQLRTNMLLSLRRPYEEIRKGYSGSLRKRLRAHEGELQYESKETDTTALMDRYRQELSGKVDLPDSILRRGKKLLAEMQQRGLGQIHTVLDQQGKKLAEVFLPEYQGRLYYIFVYSAAAGKEVSANHFLLDQIFQRYAEKPLIFDFEGSSIPGIAYFFGMFGPQETSFPVLTRNRLPQPIRWLHSRRNRHS